MSRWVWVGFGLLIVVVVVMAWRSRTEVDASRIARNDAASKSATPSTSSNRSTSPASPPTMTAPPGEPPEDVLLRFQKDEYDEITRAGGMKVTVTASGRQIVLKPKLYSGQKDYCRPVPRELEGSYECGLSLMVTLREDDTKPGQHAERLGWPSRGMEAWSGQRSAAQDAVDLWRELYAPTYQPRERMPTNQPMLRLIVVAES